MNGERIDCWNCGARIFRGPPCWRCDKASQRPTIEAAGEHLARPATPKDRLWEGVVSRIGPSTVGVIGNPGSDPPATTFEREEFSAAGLKNLRDGAKILWTRGLEDDGGTRQRFSRLDVDPRPDGNNP